mgnify:CR=1 FL=1
MLWCDRYGDNKDCKRSTRTTLPATKTTLASTTAPIIDKMGVSFNNYNFVVALDPAQSISKFWFQVDEHDGSQPKVVNNGGASYPVEQDSIIFVPTLSTVDVFSNNSYTKVYTNRVGEAFHRVYHLVAAVRSEITPSRVYTDGWDSAVKNYLYTVHGRAEFTADSSRAAQAGYKFYTASFNSSGLQLMLDLSAEVGGQTVTQKYLDALLLDNTPYVAPTTPIDRATASAARETVKGWAVMAVCVGVGTALLGSL